MENTQNSESDFISIGEAALFLKRSRGNLYNLCCQGVLKHYKPNGGRVLFKKSELQAWIEAGAVSSNAEIEAQAAARS